MSTTLYVLWRNKNDNREEESFYAETNPHWVELPLARTYLYDPKPDRAIEVLFCL